MKPCRAPQSSPRNLPARSPRSPHHSGGDRAAAVLVQQSVRRLPERCGGLGVEQHIDADLRHSRQARAHAPQMAPSRPGRNSSSPYYVQTLQALGKYWRKFTPDAKWKDLAEEDASRPSSMAPATTRSAFPMTTARALTTPSAPSKASSPISSVATKRPTATGPARRSPASPTCPATPATSYRLKPEALCVKIAERHYRRSLRHVGQEEGGGLVQRPAAKAQRQAEWKSRCACSRKSASGCASWSMSDF